MMVSLPADGLPIEWLAPPALFGVGFALSFLLTPSMAKFCRMHGLMGMDAHKPDKPLIPEMCGLTIWITLAVTSLLATFLDAATAPIYMSFLLCVTIATLIGIWDDLHPLNPIRKPLLTALAAVPIIALGAYNPYLRLPFLGATRLTIVYPLLIPIAIAVLSNAINMMNPFNGAMSGTCSVVSFTMVICLLLVGQTREAVLASALLGAILAFHHYNKHPAKAFSGNAGDLCVGAAIAALSIMGRIEVPMVIATIPHISNAFYFLSSVGGLKERRQVKARPTRLLDDGRLDATDDMKAPITLSRMILAKGPLREEDIVRIMIMLTTVSSALSIITLLVWIW